MSNTYPQVIVTDEMINGLYVDVIGKIQQLQWDAFIAGEHAKLAALTSDKVACTAYPPTSAEYWMRLQ